MTNPLQLIYSLDTSTPQKRRQPLKSRRQRRQEDRDRVRAAKLNQK